jgi:hypothetical protein
MDAAQSIEILEKRAFRRFEILGLEARVNNILSPLRQTESRFAMADISKGVFKAGIIDKSLSNIIREILMYRNS